MRIKRPYFWTAVGMVVVVTLAVAYFFYLVIAYTSDAYVRANWAPISPQVEGYLTQIHVVTDQKVAAGDPLVTIDTQPYQLKVDQAVADLAQKKAELIVIQKQLETTLIQEKTLRDKHETTLVRKARFEKLAKDNAVSKDDFDKVLMDEQQCRDAMEEMQGEIAIYKSKLISQNKAIELSEAQLKLAEYYLSQCKVSSPAEGYVTNMYVRCGQYLHIGDELFGIVERRPIWIEANYKEGFVGMIKPGQTAWVITDIYPLTVLKGKVRSIIHGVNRSDQTDSSLPYISPTIDWIRLQYRFRVIIELDSVPEIDQLRMGADARTIIFL